jgi:hypothetical protein
MKNLYIGGDRVMRIKREAHPDDRSEMNMKSSGSMKQEEMNQ